MAKQPCQRDLLIAGLKACGWVEDPETRSAKYVVFKKDEGLHAKPDTRRMYVGKSGALRMRDIARPGGVSISLTNGRTYRAYIEVGRRAAGYSTIMQALQDLMELQGGPSVRPGNGGSTGGAA